MLISPLSFGLSTPYLVRSHERQPRFRSHSRTVQDSRVSTSHIMQPKECSLLSGTPVSWLMNMMDVTAAQVASRHQGHDTLKDVATVFVNDLQFFDTPLNPFDIINTRAYMTTVKDGLLGITVEVSKANNHQKPSPIATGNFVYVPIQHTDEGSPDRPSFTTRDATPLTLVHQAEHNRAKRMEDTMEALKQERRSYIKSRFHLAYTERPAVINYRTHQGDNNFNGSTFGGVLLETMTRSAQKAKVAFVGIHPSLAQMDRVMFKEGAYPGDTLRARALPTRTWPHVMEVRVDLSRINKGEPLTQETHIGTGYFVFTAPSDQPFPKFEPSGDTQQARWEKAGTRHQTRTWLS